MLTITLVSNQALSISSVTTMSISVSILTWTSMCSTLQPIHSNASLFPLTWIPKMLTFIRHNKHRSFISSILVSGGYKTRNEQMNAYLHAIQWLVSADKLEIHRAKSKRYTKFVNGVSFLRLCDLVQISNPLEWESKLQPIHKRVIQAQPSWITALFYSMNSSR